MSLVSVCACAALGKVFRSFTYVNKAVQQSKNTLLQVNSDKDVFTIFRLIVDLCCKMETTLTVVWSVSRVRPLKIAANRQFTLET